MSLVAYSESDESGGEGEKKAEAKKEVHAPKASSLPSLNDLFSTPGAPGGLLPASGSAAKRKAEAVSPASTANAPQAKKTTATPTLMRPPQVNSKLGVNCVTEEPADWSRRRKSAEAKAKEAGATPAKGQKSKR
ncbi:unnamed protein product [Phaeothamnion confervicola]